MNMNKKPEPDAMLESAKGRLEVVLIVGYERNGGEFFVTSHDDRALNIRLLERAKAQIVANAAADRKRRMDADI